MYIKLEELEKTEIKREYRVWLELNSSMEIRGVRIAVREKAIAKIEDEEYEIFRNTFSDFVSMYALENELDKIVTEIKEKQLDTQKELKAIIELLSKLDIEGIEVEEDP